MHDHDDSKLYVDDCAALTVDMVVPYGTQVERTIEGRVGEMNFTLTVAIARGHKGWMFSCPRCGRRVAALYFPPKSTKAACRTCHGLSYGRDRDLERYLRRIEAEFSA